MSMQERDAENIDNDNSNIIANELSEENDDSFSKTESNSENNRIAEATESLDTEEKPRKNKRKIEREVYALASENEALKQKNASMEELLHKSLEAGNYHYGTVAMGLLDKAKANLAKALGEGDVEAVAAATAEIAQATSVVNEAKRISIPTHGTSDYTSTNSYGNANGDILYDWLDDNPDLDKGSPEYNESLTNQVLPFINKLENRLKRNNQMHLIASPEYFNIIDEYVDKLKETKDSKETRGKHFGSVRSRHQATNVSENRPMVLTNQQKKAAASFNMTEEKYISYLQKYAKEAKI